MESIIKGTTPTIIFKYKSINVSEITKAFLVIKQSVTTIVERDISSATVNTEDNQLEWILTQAETLDLKVGTTVFISCDWLLTSGTRGRSRMYRCEVEPSGKNEEI